jgi:hypothetical protein
VSAIQTNRDDLSRSTCYYIQKNQSHGQKLPTNGEASEDLHHIPILPDVSYLKEKKCSPSCARSLGELFSLLYPTDLEFCVLMNESGLNMEKIKNKTVSEQSNLIFMKSSFA